MSTLVTGGAGYIGSHMVHALIDRGEEVVVLDNLSNGLRGLVAHDAHFIEGSVDDSALLRHLIREHGIDAVIHFAGATVVPDSVAEPLFYYKNNTAASRTLIEACIDSGVERFIFSSTATVYGESPIALLSEATPVGPMNPYGRSKLMTEWMLEDVSGVHNFKYMVLRYFNVAGADPAGRTGQSTARATHLIKRACQVVLGRVPHLDIFGTDFPTVDGTGVRDYIHVSDLVGAHSLALDHLRAGGGSAVLNCGYGRGYSVREVIGAVERVTGRRLPIRETTRRPGDPPSLVADPTRLKQMLRWTPEHEDLERIVATALAWEKRLNAAG